jgi:hypothetical protein
MKYIAITTVSLYLFVNTYTYATDGFSSIEVTTPERTIKVDCGLDDPEILGKNIKLSDLIAIVAERNKSMKGKPEVSYDHEATKAEYKIMLAASLLGRLKDERAFQELVQLAEDPFFGMRGWAVEALMVFNDKRALPVLIKLVRENKPCNGALERAVGKLGDDSAVPELIEHFTEGGAMEAEATLKAIEEITGLSLAEMKKKWGLTYYTNLPQFKKAMHEWWKASKSKSRNGSKPA